MKAEQVPKYRQNQSRQRIRYHGCVRPVVYPPNKSIIIPAGSQGAEISLESSTDLKAWAPATLGTYTAPTNNLFFRLKLNRL